MHKGFPNKGRKIGDEIMGIPLPPELEMEFEIKGVKFYYEKMNYGYRPSRKSKFNFCLVYWVGIKRYA